MTQGWIEPGLAVPRPSHRAWWLRQALAEDPGDPAPALVGDAEADVVIVGGGYTGMWSAWFLTELEPGIRVVLLEADICGGGPSGRNGGFITGWWDELDTLVELFGEEPALRTARALGRSIRAIGEWSDHNGVDAEYVPGGYLSVASSPAQEGSWSEAVALARRLGVGEEFVALSPDEVRARCASPAIGGGVLMRDGAIVQPAKLARGLRRVLLGRGVTIHERTPATAVRTVGGGVEVALRGGTVRAGAGVLAPNAWGIGMRALSPRLTAWGSYIVLTAPAPDRLAEIGWTGGECITDERSALHYFRTTGDGRIALGGGGGRAGFGSRIESRLSSDEVSFRRTAEGFRRLFPSFADVPLVDAWGGPIDVSPTHLPFFGTLPGGRMHFGLGYSGNGVGPSHMGGRILAALALKREDDYTRLPVVGFRPRRFPPEPLRSLGAFVVREAVVRMERTLDAGRRPDAITSLVATLPRRLGYHLGPGPSRRH